MKQQDEGGALSMVPRTAKVRSRYCPMFEWCTEHLMKYEDEVAKVTELEAEREARDKTIAELEIIANELRRKRAMEEANSLVEKAEADLESAKEAHVTEIIEYSNLLATAKREGLREGLERAAEHLEKEHESLRFRWIEDLAVEIRALKSEEEEPRAEKVLRWCRTCVDAKQDATVGFCSPCTKADWNVNSYPNWTDKPRPEERRKRDRRGGEKKND